MDQLAELRMFVRLVERGSFTVVAREFATSQATVSRRVAGLEDRLAVRLLLRTTRRVTPTESGAELYERAKRALEAVDDAEASVKGSFAAMRGRLRIGAPIAYGSHVVVPAMAGFRQRFPKIEVEISFNDRYVDLTREGVDVAIRLGDLPDSTMHAKHVGREALVVVAAPEYVARRGVPAHVSDLLSHDGVVLLRSGTPARWAFRTGKKDPVFVTLQGPVRLDSIIATHMAARAGLGIAVVPRYLAAKDLANGALVSLLDGSEPIGLKVYAVFPTGRRVTGRVQAFVGHLESALRG
jgi:DNA-binding transcriptional LysR family regulator